MGGSQSINNPGNALGDYAFSLRAPEVHDETKPHFVAPRRCQADSYAAPVVAGVVDDSAKGTGLYPDMLPVAAAIPVPRGDTTGYAALSATEVKLDDVEVKSESKLSDDDMPAWEECPLRELMTYEQLETILARVNGIVLPLLIESRVLKVKPSKKKGKPAKIEFDCVGDMPGQYMVWSQKSHWDMAMLSRVANDTLRRLADAIDGLEAITVHAHTPKPWSMHSGRPCFFLVFVFSEPHGAASRAAAGGAGAVPPGQSDASSSDAPLLGAH